MTHTFALAVVVPAAGRVKAGLATVPFARALLVELAKGLLAVAVEAEVETEGVLVLVPTAGLLAVLVAARPSLPVVDVDEAEVGRTPPSGGLGAVEALVRALSPVLVAVGVGRAIRPVVVLAVRPAAVVAAEGAVRLAALGAIEALGLPAVDEDEADDDAAILAAAAAEADVEPNLLLALGPVVDRAEAVVA